MLPRFSRYLLRIPKEMKEDKNRRNIWRKNNFKKIRAR
jgi:hypothetical protein